ncbi:MAG: hypothetical protein FWE17_01325 [Alphaproteobacteria bacterium]|nr:hypothetical protein [Alphaproteobacteria bacterium]MCL2758093.1 hypothetical protein [Alphaproteobacteria bacterium]
MAYTAIQKQQLKTLYGLKDTTKDPQIETLELYGFGFTDLIKCLQSGMNYDYLEDELNYFVPALDIIADATAVLDMMKKDKGQLEKKYTLKPFEVLVLYKNGFTYEEIVKCVKGLAFQDIINLLVDGKTKDEIIKAAKKKANSKGFKEGNTKINSLLKFEAFSSTPAAKENFALGAMAWTADKTIGTTLWTSAHLLRGAGKGIKLLWNKARGT